MLSSKSSYNALRVAYTQLILEQRNKTAKIEKLLSKDLL